MRLISIVVLSMLFLMACSDTRNTPEIPKDSKIYQLAEELSEKLPSLNPDDNRVLAQTKNEVVTVADVVDRIDKNFGSRMDQFKTLDTERMKGIISQIAENVAMNRMLIKNAENAGITLTQTELDSIVEMQYHRAGGQEKFMQMLEKNQVSIDQVKQDIHDGMMIQRYMQEILKDKVTVTEAEIEEAYNSDKTATVRHILFMTQGKSDEEKAEIRTKAEGILKRAQNGEDFSALAKEFSEDPGSKDKGGLYENFPKGQMVKSFEDAAFGLPIGSISDIVETQFGFHIIKVIDRKKETKPLKQVKAILTDALQKRKRSDAYKAFIDNLKKENDFKIEVM